MSDLKDLDLDLLENLHGFYSGMYQEAVLVFDEKKKTKKEIHQFAGKVAKYAEVHINSLAEEISKLKVDVSETENVE